LVVRNKSISIKTCLNSCAKSKEAGKKVLISGVLKLIAWLKKAMGLIYHTPFQ
jgi:hypothetical protein